jgi:hypothetical protein
MKSHTRALASIARMLSKATDAELRKLVEKYDGQARHLEGVAEFQASIARDRAREVQEQTAERVKQAEAAEKAAEERKGTLRARIALRQKFKREWMVSGGNEAEFQRLLRERDAAS